MLRFPLDVDGVPLVIGVNFEYTPYNPNDPEQPRDTMCTLQCLEVDGVDVAQRSGKFLGRANQHWMDNFNHKVGRKIAFKRALEKVYPEREYRGFRKQLWQQFFKQVKIQGRTR